MEKSNNIIVAIVSSVFALCFASAANADNENQYEPAIQDKLNLIEVDHHSLDFFNELVDKYHSAKDAEEKGDITQALNAQMSEAVKRLGERLKSELSYNPEHTASADLAKRRAADAENLKKMTTLLGDFEGADGDASGVDSGGVLNQFSHSWLLTQSNEIAEAWAMMLQSQQ